MPLARCDRCENFHFSTDAFRLSFGSDVCYMMLCMNCCKNYQSHIVDHPLSCQLISETREFKILEKEKIPYVKIIEAVQWVWDHEATLTKETEDIALLYFKRLLPDTRHYIKAFKLCKDLVKDLNAD